MKQYIENESGNFDEGGRTIPNSDDNKYFIIMNEEVEAGKAKITAFKHPTQSQRDAAREKGEGLAYLSQTDWYVIRKIEKDIPIPANITTKRNEARGKAGKS